ncbi:beta-lactamase family protein [Weeksellaceae bacterium KMM 9724]|uniref:serine hydrolase domain-containing protein n=1 Tax=Profundicola chukchiensis TaxID=2961959 RepID=UPI00243A6E1F|nr:serine hydrolase domain-containing protein [Profundicola chukchiensis]MDG4949705.1 beta-lactamase family protein [Profundicola chukchiensis]
MFRIYNYILFIFLLSQTGIAQDFNKEKLDQYFKLLEENDKFMGSLALAKDGKLIYSKNIGFADIEKGIKINDNSRFSIASISKTFTASLVLKAVEQNKIKLDQKLADFYPEITNAEKISIEQMLRHQSGIHNITDDPVYGLYFTQATSQSEMLKVIKTAGSDFEPGSKTAYSNSNYILLSFILEKIYKKEFAEILKEQITKPLKLTKTYFNLKTGENSNEVNSYMKLMDWQISPKTSPSVSLGAGGIVSTPEDLIKFAYALFGGKLLQEKNLKLMMEIKDGYGLGLFPVPFYDKVGYGHTGGIDGFRSMLFHFEDGNYTYALTSNGSDFDINEINIAVLSAVYNKEFELPDFSTYAVDSSILESYVGNYSSEMLPLKIKVFTKDGNLMAQATGQSAFPLKAFEKDKFRFIQAGIELEFETSKNEMTLKQGGAAYLFKKD